MSDPVLLSKRAALALALLIAALPSLGAPALADNKTVPAFEAFVKAFAGVNDYKEQLAGHETTDNGASVQNRTSDYRWRRNPFAAYIAVTDGSNKGGVAVWHGGDTISGHKGGMLSLVHLTLNIHDGQATSLRGDTIESAGFDFQIKHFLATLGTMSEAPGPTIDGQATTTVTLAVADPSKNGNVSKDVLHLSNGKHLPLRREEYVGASLVKSENYNNLQTNVGLTDNDFR
jgi:outer membrane lipoprotein-sorting protein